MFLHSSRECCLSFFFPTLATSLVLLVELFLLAEREGVHPIDAGLFVDGGLVRMSGKEWAVMGIRSTKMSCAQVQHSWFAYFVRRWYEFKNLNK